MTDEIMNQEIPTQDLTDEQVDKFFESGGKEEEVGSAPKAEENQSEGQENTEANSEVGPQEETPEQAEEKHARNYQAAMKEERQRRQEIERVLAETKAQQAADKQRMEERFQEVINRIKQQEPQMQVPSFDEDPLGHQQHVIKELQDYVLKQNEYLQSQQEVSQREYQRQQFERAYMGQAQEFSKVTPDFMDAYNYLVSKKMGEYMAAGLSEAQANQQITREEAQVVSLAFQQGVNPAERVYAMARASGYAKAQPQAQASNENAEVAKKLEQIQKSMAANKSLSQAGGKSDSKPSLSLQSIADMDDDEFDKVDWKKLVRAA